MSNVRVMFIGQGPSGFAEDRVVNTFHFHGPGAFDFGDIAGAINAVAEFYNSEVGVPTNQGRSLAEWLSPWVSRDAELRGYNLEDGRPRVPVIQPLTLNAAGSSTGLPEEVCLVASMTGAPPVTRRRRGRLFFGPLVAMANHENTATTNSSPQDGLREDLAIACKRLADTTLTDLDWCIRSIHPAENFVPIVGGHVDNAFDTQRRRGPDATIRTSWVAAA